jgi:Domain of unknown function (DUF4157)
VHVKAFAPKTSETSAGKHQSTAKRNLPVPVFPVSAMHGDGALLQRKASCACGGGCPSCAQKAFPKAIQTKLKVSKPGDRYEQEADRVAEQIMRMPDPMLQRKCMSCSDASDKSYQEEEPQIRRQASGEGNIDAVASDLTSHLGTGAPLDSASRRFFEPRFGYDFSGVRIHDDARADVSARAVRALAYTLGPHVVFRAGTFSPASSAGKRLLAHELVHVVQQSGVKSGRSLTPSPGPQVARQTDTEEPESTTEEEGSDSGAPAPPTPEQIASATGQTLEPDRRGGTVVHSTASSPDEDPEVAASSGPIPSNTLTCVRKWQPCRAPYSPGTWAARMTYHCPRLVLPWGIILPGTTRPAFATIPDEFIGVDPITGRDRYRCRPGSSVRFRADIADTVATVVTRGMLFPSQAACHAGFRTNLWAALEFMFTPSGGGRPAGIRVNSTAPGGGGIPFPCP